MGGTGSRLTEKTVHNMCKIARSVFNTAFAYFSHFDNYYSDPYFYLFYEQ